MTKDEQIADLRDQLDLAQERIKQLEVLVHGERDDEFVHRARTTLGLPPLAAKMLCAVVRKGQVRKQAIFVAVYGNRLEVPDIRVIDVMMVRVRNALKPYGARVDTLFGYGYQMSDDDRHAIERIVMGTPNKDVQTTVDKRENVPAFLNCSR